MTLPTTTSADTQADAPDIADPVHCDDLIDDASQPECLRDFLRYARLPAVCKLPGVSAEKLAGYLKWIEADQHAHVWTDPEPALFARLKSPLKVVVEYPSWVPRPPRTVALEAGTEVRVVMASRFGDVGITQDLKATHGYLARLQISELEAFSSDSSLSA